MKKTDTPAFRRWFRNSKVVDAKGEPLEVYHGTDKAGFFEFDESTFGDNSQNTAGFFFTSDPQLAASYAKGPPAAVVLERFDTLEEFLANVPEDFDVEEYFFVQGDNELYDSMEALEEAWELEEGDIVQKLYEVGFPDGCSATYPDDEEEALLHDINDAITRREFSGIYKVYLRIEDPLIVDADDANWDEVPWGDWEDEDGNLHPETATTNEIVREAQDMGYDGVIFKDLFDPGGKGYGSESGDVYVVFDPRQIKDTLNRGSWDANDPVLINPSPRRKRRNVKGYR